MPETRAWSPSDGIKRCIGRVEVELLEVPLMRTLVCNAFEQRLAKFNRGRTVS